VEIARLLIERGAHVNHVDRWKMTPLLWSASVDFGESELIEVLTRAGADKATRDSNGLTALDLARRYKHTHLIASLVGHTEE
jgi:ankyrin repeat protein